MKKLIFNVCGAAIVAAAIMFNLQANLADADSVSLIESVQIEAIAGSGAGGICCDWPLAECEHPYGYFFDDAIWLADFQYCP